MDCRVLTVYSLLLENVDRCICLVIDTFDKEGVD